MISATCGNVLTRTDAGVSPNILVAGAQPKWFLEDSLEENLDLTIASSDPQGALQENIRKRTLARTSWLRTETLHRMDRAVLSRPGRIHLVHPGQLAQFYREQTHQGGRRMGVWKGPAVVIVLESTSGSIVPRIVYVAYGGRPYLCSPEGVRPACLRRRRHGPPNSARAS